MDARILVLAALGLLVMPGAALSQGAILTASGAPIGLGFGPLSIVPVSVGTPVFALGDGLWVRSYLNSSILFLSLREPNGTVTPTTYLEPGGLIRMRTFTSEDPLGTWTVATTTASTGATDNATFTLASANLDLAPQLTGANVSGNSLRLTFSLPPSLGYNIQACTLGAQSPLAATYQLPKDVGGAMTVALQGDSAMVSTPPALSQFSVWLELYALRSYDEGGSLVSLTTLASSTGVLSAGSTQEQQAAALGDQLYLRTGRYELRTFVRGPSGLTAYDSQFLKTGPATWVSLDGCTQLSSVASSKFVMRSSMDDSNSTWPRSLVTMYDYGGIENFSVASIPVAEARIDARSSVQNGKLTGASLGASGQGILAWGQFDSSLYVVAAQFPLNVTVSVDFEGVATESFDMPSLASYSAVPLFVPVGTLHMLATSQGQPLANATIVVTDGPNLNPHQPTYKTSSSGTFTYTLPPGNYTMTVATGTKSVAVSARVEPGGVASVAVELGEQTVPYLLYLAAGAMVVGVALNILFWRAYLERRATYRQLH